MEEKERLERVAIIVELFERLGRKGADGVIDGLVRGTASVPRVWLREAIREVSGTWTHSMAPPTCGDLYRAATRRAGMRARYSAWGGYTDPTPELVKWWPKPAARLTAELREAWWEKPEALGLSGACLRVPTQRRLPLPEAQLSLPDSVP